MGYRLGNGDFSLIGNRFRRQGISAGSSYRPVATRSGVDQFGRRICFFGVPFHVVFEGGFESFFGEY